MEAQLDSTACYRSKISYNRSEDAVCIEHYSEHGALLSRIKLGCEDAYDYMKMLEDVIDFAFEID